MDGKIGYKHSQATLLSKLTFFWLTPLLWRGYKDPLEMDDLGTLHESETCRAHYDRFQYIYRSQKVREISKRTHKCVIRGHVHQLCNSQMHRLNMDMHRCAFAITYDSHSADAYVNITSFSVLVQCVFKFKVTRILS